MMKKQKTNDNIIIIQLLHLIYFSYEAKSKCLQIKTTIAVN